ncbi:MAG: phosphoglycerate dehydrogenase [Salinibacter sp.]
MTETILVTARSFRAIEGPHQRALEDAGFGVRYSPHDRPLHADELSELIRDVAGAILGVDAVSADVIQASARLKVISRYGIGVDNVDLDAATERGIVVTNTPGTNSTSVAELTMALMLALARNFPRLDRDVKAGRWTRVYGKELSGATLGVVGLGRIGRRVAELGSAFGMRCIYYDVVDPPAEVLERLEIDYAPWDELLAQSDVVTLHLPYTDDTHHVMDEAALAKMKSSAFLINTSRGGLVDEFALYNMLQDGGLGGAAFDAFAEEPPEDHPLLALDNVVATPHIGAATRQSTVRTGQLAVDNALAVLHGDRPHYVVNSEVYEQHAKERYDK